jgi:hypothetical protein
MAKQKQQASSHREELVRHWELQAQVFAPVAVCRRNDACGFCAGRMKCPRYQTK